MNKHEDNSFSDKFPREKEEDNITPDVLDDEEKHLESLDDESYDPPTEEEEKTLRRVSAPIPWSCWIIAVVELCERFAYYGLTGPFQNYMQHGRDDHIRGALALGQNGANALSYFLQFWCYVTPIFGAWVSDTFWGKYKTIFVFAVIYMVGILILFLTSLPVSIRHGAAEGGFIVGIIVIGLGTGGVKSNVSPLIADQIPHRPPRVVALKTGERVIVDPAITIQTVFMVFYMCINVGSLSAIATTELEKNVDFWAAFLLPLCFFVLAIVSLIAGKNMYVKKPPSKSVINNSFKIAFIAIINKFSIDAAKPSLKPEANYPWTDLFVEEVRRAVMACKVFCFYPIYWLVYGQMLNNFVSQAGQMETHGLPNDIMQNIDPIAVILFIPVAERLIYPTLRRFGISFKPITRITWGFFFVALAMAYAAIVQHIIYSAGPCYDHPLACSPEFADTPNRVHVAIQTPAYCFIAISEILASITGLEYAYTKAPASMKSFIMSLFLVTNAFGAAIGIALSPTSKDPKLVWTYTGLCCATVVAGTFFWFCYKHYNKNEDELNNLENNFRDDEVLSPITSKAIE
ncbi:peptide transporter Ptr2p [[Candida] anglica]|uniref:Peptide transporter Ptr2p n=1 Tax=[Candida] anglica TaxID=148631 RepID=A0ABP0EL15_9ASCO